MPEALPLAENMFGKMRGRFDEDAARAVVRRLADSTFSSFLALPEEEKEELAGRLRQFYANRPGWTLNRKVCP